MKEIKVTGRGWWEGCLEFDTEEHAEDFDSDFFIAGDLIRRSKFGENAIPDEVKYLFFDDRILKPCYREEVIASPVPYGCITAVVTGINEFGEEYRDEHKLYWRAIIACHLDDCWFIGWNDLVIEKAVKPLLLGTISGYFEKQIIYHLDTQIYAVQPVVGTVFVNDDLFDLKPRADFINDNSSIVYENMTWYLKTMVSNHPELKQAMDDAAMEASIKALQAEDENHSKEEKQYG